jgi:hypothetical protein
LNISRHKKYYSGGTEMKQPEAGKTGEQKRHGSESQASEQVGSDEETPVRKAQGERHTPKEENLRAAAQPEQGGADQRAEASGEANSMGAAGNAVKTGITASLRGIDEIESEIVSLVRNTVSNALRATGAMGTEAVEVARDVVKGALSATDDLGTGLAVTTKSVAKGVVLGVSDVGGDVVSAATETAKAAVSGVAAVGGDTLMVAKRTVDGVMEATTETGGNVVETRAVAGGAAEAIGGIGTTAVSSVRNILLSVVTGVKDVANAALPKPQETGGRVPPTRTPSAAEHTSPT